MPDVQPPTDFQALLEAHLKRTEHANTAALIERLAPARARSYLTYGEFFAICCWKERRQRGRKYWQLNRERSTRIPERVRIELYSEMALAATDERARMEALLHLRGVGIPIASAILTILDPEHYGVIDVRAWQTLYQVKAVTTNPEGRNFTLDEWLTYIDVLRRWARHFKTSPRRIEHSLYLYHAKASRRRTGRRRRRPAATAASIPAGPAG